MTEANPTELIAELSTLAAHLADALEAERERAELAEADNAALLEIAGQAATAVANDDRRNNLFKRLDNDHPGQPVHDELRALRRVRDAVEQGCDCHAHEPGGHYEDCPIRAALDAAKEAGR